MTNKDRLCNLVMAIAGGVVGAMLVASGLPARLWPSTTAEAATRHLAHTIRLISSFWSTGQESSGRNS